jgi:hypothetical protein
MSKMADLLKQKEELEKAITEEAKAGRVEAVKQVREMIKQYKITTTDLRGLLKTRRTKKQKEADEVKIYTTAADKKPATARKKKIAA